MREKLIAKIAEIAETESNLVQEDSKLSSLGSWDSITDVVFIAYAISDFGVKITGDEMLLAETVGDLIQLIEHKKQL